ncbi:MAG: hypothetical protein NTU56_09185 [Proteobacteria bacterium]|nr:hypothetical protein [Pseudomonadota bacterium]
MLESILVGMIVVAATAYAAWALTPAVSRNRFALRLAHGLGGAEAPGLRGRAATWLQKLAKAPVGGCGDCPANTLTPAERAQQNKQAD